MLDEKQRELLRDAMQKNRDEMQKLDEKLRNAQKDLVSAAIAEKYDEKTVREKAEAVSKIQTDMMVLRVKGFSSVAPTLKPEQREQLENSRMGTMMVLGGGFGGGMGGGFGGPGGPGGQGGPRRGAGGPGGPGGQGQ
ncbi:MAG: Heavy-metal resistance [Verrucomicrobiales bacterium]|nr:Heavy-metal resistance [Verrucomicrobiales bacterium]